MKMRAYLCYFLSLCLICAIGLRVVYVLSLPVAHVSPMDWIAGQMLLGLPTLIWILLPVTPDWLLLAVTGLSWASWGLGAGWLTSKLACRSCTRRHATRTIILIGLLAAWPMLMPAQSNADTIHYPDLVGRLTNLSILAHAPQPGEAAAMFSSYDRRSQYEEATGTYLNWTANSDGHGVLERHEDHVVLAEMDGPGVIWRIWSAQPGYGNIRIFLDGDAAPVLELPFVNLFSGTLEPFNFEQLTYKTAGGFNSYVPIPFNRHCRIEADPDWGLFYHINWTAYPAWTNLQSFSLPLAGDARTALQACNRVLAQRQAPSERALERKLPLEETPERHIAPNQAVTIWEDQGPGAMTGLELFFPDAAHLHADFGRTTVLELYWDNRPAPAVAVPVVDFFGTAPEPVFHKTYPAGMNPNGWYANWYMPYAQSARMVLRNEGNQPVAVRARIAHHARTLPAPALRFHAAWHRDLPTEPDRPIDWPLAHLRGRGRYVGTVLHVLNYRGGWWGEGDEKFHIDGEPFPSIFGTGTEDYFGYAWCSTQRFAAPFHSQTRSSPGHRGHIAVARWHLTDNLPFHDSLDAYLEKYFSNDRGTHYAATVFWYQDETGTALPPLAPVQERIRYGRPRPLTRLRWAVERIAKDLTGPDPM